MSCLYKATVSNSPLAPGSGHWPLWRPEMPVSARYDHAVTAAVENDYYPPSEIFPVPHVERKSRRESV